MNVQLGEQQKECVSCKVVKAIDQFDRRGTCWHSYCKVCRTEKRQRKRAESHPEILEKERLRREKNRETNREYQRNWARNNKEKAHSYYENNKDRIKARVKAYSKTPEAKRKAKLRLEKNKPERLAKRRVYAKTPAVKAKKKEWSLKNSEKVKEQKRGSWVRSGRAIYYKDQYDITPEQFKVMFDAQGGLCGICKKFMDNPQLDHCHRTKKNRMLLCPSCNLGLGNSKEDIEVIKGLIEYKERHALDLITS